MLNEALGRVEAVVDTASVDATVEAMLPVGVRPRQLSVRTLLVGILLALCDGRPGHLSRVHEALVSLPAPERRRLGVEAAWSSGPHLLSYRQVERTFSLVAGVLGKNGDRHRPTEVLGWLFDRLVEASVTLSCTPRSSSLAVDWTDVESFSQRRPTHDGAYSDPDASWGHRKGGGPGERDELFFGYYLQFATMMRDETGPEVAELVRRMTLASCCVDPPPLMAGVLAAMAEGGVALGDVLCDSGYAHRLPEHWAQVLRAARAELVMDLHPADRGTQGTHLGAISNNGSLYCPATPVSLLSLRPLARQATEAETADHDARTQELDRYRLGRVSAPDDDGYERVGCPATLGKLRCPLRTGSMSLDYGHPEVTQPPEDPPRCCVQRTITVPPSVNAKSKQKHPFPSKAHRTSYARRTGVERSNSRVKDPASIDISRGWCRVMGLAPLGLFLVCAVVVSNLRVADAFSARQADNDRRRAAGLEPRTRRRRRRSVGDLVAAGPAPP